MWIAEPQRPGRKAADRNPLDVPTARERPIVASSPLSRVAKRRRGAPSRIERATWRPCCIATGATPCSCLPARPTTMSPRREAPRGGPGGSGRARRAAGPRGRARRRRLHRAARASGEAATPAAQIAVRAGICSRAPSRGSTSIESASTPTTVVCSSGVTPSERNCRSALAERAGRVARRTRSPASTSSTRARRVSTARYSRGARRVRARRSGRPSRRPSARPDDDEGEPALPRRLVLLDLRGLERAQDPVAQVERARRASSARVRYGAQSSWPKYE